MADSVYTIGHSTHPAERLIELLQQHGITALADVRSNPYSRYNPQYNREPLEKVLEAHGIAYRFMGAELGARSSDPGCYEGGKVSYEKLAETPAFRRGLERVENGIKDHRIALMCAEKEPLECHRFILVSRHLVARGIDVVHIHEDGTLESHAAAMERLAQLLYLPEADLFRSHEEILEEAYQFQGRRIAYSREEIDSR